MPVAQKMTDLTLPIFPVEAKKLRIQMIDYRRIGSREKWPCEPTCGWAAASARGWAPLGPSYTQKSAELFSDLQE